MSTSENVPAVESASVVEAVKQAKELLGTAAEFYAPGYVTVQVSEVLRKVDGLLETILTGGDVESFLDGTGLYFRSPRNAELFDALDSAEERNEVETADEQG